MKPKQITDKLNSIDPDDFEYASEELVGDWESDKVGFEAVEPILKFMEEHPDIEYGMPGALVHFVENFCGKGYEEKLLESLARRPTAHTTWMLNRVINATRNAATKKKYLAAMENAKSHPEADDATIQSVEEFLAPEE